MTDSSLLKVANLKVHYGPIQAVRGISFEVHKGEVVTLIGSNGAGKSSTLRALSGLVETTGSVSLNGQSLLEVPPHERVSLGLAHSPEGRGVFAQMSVLENLELGAFHLNRGKLWGSSSAISKQRMQECFELFPRLAERRRQMAGTLSGGEQQMLAISRALMSEPQILMLDEPSLGLAPKLVSLIFEIVDKLNQRGMTILLVEQNARMALKHSHRAYVLETGSITLSGTSKELLHNSDVQKSYLGG